MKSLFVEIARNRSVSEAHASLAHVPLAQRQLWEKGL